MPEKDETKWFDALHSDLKELSEKIQRIEVSIAKMDGSNVGAKLEKHDAKIEKLEDFKSRVTGALIVINLIWGIVGALIIWKLTR